VSKLSLSLVLIALVAAERAHAQPDLHRDAGTPPDAVAPPAPEPVRHDDGAPRFGVRGVGSSDVLNVRASANPRGKVVGTIPPDATEVRTTGKRLKRGRSLWWEVSYGQVHGWVNSRFLARRREPQIPPSPAAPGDVFTETLTCFLDEPLWRIDIRKDGRAACSETCDGPEGLRATPPRTVKGKAGGWSVEIRDVQGSAFMALDLRRTGRCTEDFSDDRYAYEISARRPRGPAYKGCCNSLGPRKK
jgi:uncharacterized membrane protein